jgi:hypothetical protein
MHMPKTTEELQKIINQNYKKVQESELQVYDKNEALKKQFVQDEKSLATQLKNELKEITEKRKQVKQQFKSELEELIKKGESHQSDILLRREKTTQTYEQSIVAANKKFEEEVKKLNQAIEEENQAYKKLVKSVLDEYNKNIANAKKTIEKINEKGLKDQATFQSKLEELKAKYDAKVKETSEKEETKIAKLNEACEKEVNKQEDLMVSERKKLDDKLEALRPVYLEELEEINDNIQQKKEEYEAKHESIRSSADQRIAVREKHMHRAMDDNDSRSAKQHKKDIEKYRKEADKDLVLLRKNYNQENEQAQEYRKNFIKENFEKLANLEREYKEFEEAKQKEIDELQIKLTHDINLTKLDFEKQQAELLQEYNKDFKEIRVKQEDVLRQQELDVEAQENIQMNLTISFDKTNIINEENHKLILETRAKELRDAEIEKRKDELLEKDVLDNEVSKLENEKTLADLELAQNKDLLIEKEIVENHRFDQLQMSSHKEEFFGFQTNLEPLFLHRAEQASVFEEQEVNNRYQIKLSFLQKQLTEMKEDYDKLVEKIKDVYDKEKAPLEAIIEKIAGDQKTELETIEEVHQEKVTAIKEKIDGLHPRKDKKQIRDLEDDLAELEDDYEQNVKQKKANIHASTKTYQVALDAATSRYEKALEEAEKLFDNENLRFQKSIEMLQTNQIAELDDVKMRKMQTETSVQDFLSSAATRNTLNTEDNQSYLSDLIAQAETRMSNRVKLFENQREQENNRFNQQLQELANIKKEALEQVTQDFGRQESDLESFKSMIESNQKQAEEKATFDLNTQVSKTHAKNDEINAKFDANQKVIKDTLDNQTEEFNTKMQSINKNVNEENNHYDSEEKRVHKEYEQRLKDSLKDIDAALATDIKNIQ